MLKGYGRKIKKAPEFLQEPFYIFLFFELLKQVLVICSGANHCTTETDSCSS